MEHIETREEGREGRREECRERKEMRNSGHWKVPLWVILFFFPLWFFLWKSRKWSHCTSAHEAMLHRHLTLVPGQSILPMEGVSLLYMKKRDWKAYHTLKLAREAHKAVAVFLAETVSQNEMKVLSWSEACHPPQSPLRRHGEKRLCQQWGGQQAGRRAASLHGSSKHWVTIRREDRKRLKHTETYSQTQHLQSWNKKRFNVSISSKVIEKSPEECLEKR